MLNKTERAVFYIWLGAMALVTAWFIRPSLYQPIEPTSFEKAEKRLQALRLGMYSYHVDYAAFPVAKAAAPALSSPISYMTKLFNDPYSPENKEKLDKLDLQGEAALGRVRLLYVLALIFGLALVFLGVLPLRPWGLEQIVLLWLMFCLPVATLALVSRAGANVLGLASLGVLLAGPWALFIVRRLSLESLLFFMLSVVMIIIALKKQDHDLLWVAVALVGIGGARLAASSGALGKLWLQGWRTRNVSMALQAEICALSLILAAACTSILLADWVLRERAHVANLEKSGTPVAFLSQRDFFAASSNGPDFKRNWDSKELDALLKKKKLAAAEDYLRSRSFDPTNGVNSLGDYIVYARRPEAPTITASPVQKTSTAIARKQKKSNA